MRKLPESVQQIADLIGRERALELVRRWPKVSCGAAPPRASVYIPRSLRPDHRLVEILGWRDADKITRSFPGEIIFLAECADEVREYRREEIARMVSAGARVPEIAARLCMSERQARRLVAAISAVVRQSINPDHPPDTTSQRIA